MIDLSKKYKTVYGSEVRLYDIIDNVVIGAVQHHSSVWRPTDWSLTDGINSFSEFNLVEVPNFKAEKFDQSKLTKYVKYLNKLIEVPVWTKYVFVGVGGNVYVSRTKPQLQSVYYSSWNFDALEQYQIVGRFDYTEGHWQDSLVEV